MQDTIFYVAAGETLGTVRDYANAKTVPTPTLVRGVAACLRMRLFARKEGNTPYPMDALAGIVEWKWAMNSDFSEATSYKLEADNADIVLSEVEEEIDGEDCVFTQLSIPIPDMNTEELSEWLGTEKSKNGLHGELVGYDASGASVFILQVENFTVRNRITSLGDPTPISPDYLTRSQVEALVAAGLECQFSSGGTSWHGTPPEFLTHGSASASGTPAACGATRSGFRRVRRARRTATPSSTWPTHRTRTARESRLLRQIR